MKQFAILGYPLGHTLSPQLHRLLARELGEQIDYQIGGKTVELFFEDTAADPYIATIKRLVVNEKLDFDTAKVLISEYKKTKHSSEL